jgi:hypothetical protein
MLELQRERSLQPIQIPLTVNDQAWVTGLAIVGVVVANIAAGVRGLERRSQRIC